MVSKNQQKETTADSENPIVASWRFQEIKNCPHWSNRILVPKPSASERTAKLQILRLSYNHLR